MDITLGRIVLYTLSKMDAEEINRRRAAGPGGVPEHPGVMVHTGNSAREGEILPAVAVRVWNGGLANLQVLLDGNDTYWASSRATGSGSGHWHWPERTSA